MGRIVIMSLVRAFLGALVLGAIGVNVYAHATRESATSRTGQGPNRELVDRVAVRDQLSLAALPELKAAGYRTIIALRPDGEAPDQVPSSAVAAGARASGMHFTYIPTPRGTIPDSVVDALSRELAEAPRPILLYCRSGSRAARAWALAEASRTGGPDAEQIALAVGRAGQRVDDLRPHIAARIAARTRSSP